MRRLLLLALLPVVALSAPPYNADITITIPEPAGPIEGIRLYLDCDPTTDSCEAFASLGDSDLGVKETYDDLIEADGAHTLWAEAFNDSANLSTFSDSFAFSTTAILAPGKPVIQLQVDCEPCVFTVQ